MSAYVNEQLTIKEGLFRNSHVTPAARANDTTDVWAVRHGCYTREPAQPFRTATHRSNPMRRRSNATARPTSFPAPTSASTRSLSSTNWSRTARRCSAFKEFREEAERKKFRHFLEVFDPNVSQRHRARKAGRVHQRQHHPQPRRRAGIGPAGVSEDRLSRPARDGRTRAVRSATSSSAFSAAAPARLTTLSS